MSFPRGQHLCVSWRHEGDQAMSLRVLTVLLLAATAGACGSSNYSTSPSSTPQPAPPGSTSVTMVSGASGLTTTAFNPNPVNVSVGTTVSWLNSDGTTHNVVANGGAFASGNVDPNNRFNFTFATAGTFQYHCSIHTNMVGTVVVQ
jgi:plastocyanin